MGGYEFEVARMVGDFAAEVTVRYYDESGEPFSVVSFALDRAELVSLSEKIEAVL